MRKTQVARMLAIAALLACIAVVGRAMAEGGYVTTLFSKDEISKWRLTPGYENERPWQFRNGAYRGFNSWSAHPAVFDNFTLEVEIMFSGKGEGGIVLRGDMGSRKPWESGYELDIDWAQDKKHGHIHFPVKPQPYPGEALIDVGKWHIVKVEAKGQDVIVALDGKEVLKFTDAEFSQGNICLEGHTDGVKYRNLKVTPIAE